MKRWALLALGLGLTAFTPSVHAQVVFGPQLAWGDDTDFGVGGRIEFDLGGPLALEDEPFSAMFGSGSVSYFFHDCASGTPDRVDCSFIEFNGNANIPFTIEGSSAEGYLGSGLHIARFSVDYQGTAVERDLFSDTEIGINLLGGFKFPVSGLTAFAQGKFGLIGAEQFVVSAGILFGG